MKQLLTLKAMNTERGELTTEAGQRMLMLGITLQAYCETGSGQPEEVTLPTVWMTLPAAADLPLAIRAGLSRDFSKTELQSAGLLEERSSTH